VDSSFWVFAQNEKEGFQDALMYINEIEPNSLNVEMLVLSACDPHLKQRNHNEDLLSLFQSLYQKGIHSIIASRWVVPEKASSEIILSLYKYLQEGLAKDDALRSSKLAYIQNNHGINQEPYYWANLIALGKMRPVELEYNIWKFAGPIIAIFLIFIFFRKRMFNDSPL